MEKNLWMFILSFLFISIGGFSLVHSITYLETGNWFAFSHSQIETLLDSAFLGAMIMTVIRAAIDHFEKKSEPRIPKI